MAWTAGNKCAIRDNNGRWFTLPPSPPDVFSNAPRTWISLIKTTE